MEIKSSMKEATNENLINTDEQKIIKKVDINILLNRVKNEKKDAVVKKFLITVGALGSLVITGIISIL
tara:strand:+ start:366 stop:569 length:204 start_codon:yes stop_codon:yes gene_type:complete